jgi:serine/threonine-protein kinase
MISNDGEVKLADMGLARETADMEAAQSEAGKAYGTPYYIAPEQIRGSIDIDERADIYGLGATLYNMVTGRVPFMAEDSAEVMKKHLKEKLVPPDHINTKLSAGISEVIEIMMAKRKDDRYKNVEELLLDLEALRNGQPPLRARRRIDVSMLEQLGKGEVVEVPDEKRIASEALANYKMAVLILATVSVVLFVIIVVLLVF